jgi:hypothetical protein
MSNIDSAFIKRFVAATQNVELDEQAATHLAKVSEQAFRTLGRVAGSSLFDTEPARFEAAMGRLAGDDDD